MKLKEALEIAKDCGLEDVGESLYNITMHAMSIFNYNEEKQEIEELFKDFKNSGFKKDDTIESCLNKLEDVN